MGRAYVEWRRMRDQAGELLFLMSRVPPSRRGEAWRIYHLWRDWKLPFTEARKRILALAERHELP